MKRLGAVVADLVTGLPSPRPNAWRRSLHALTGRLPAIVVHAEIEPGSDERSPLFERYFVGRAPAWLGGWTAYVHHYLRSDPDRGPHDHPWDWAVALQLAGGYDEERLNGFDGPHLRFRYSWRRPGVPYRLTGADFHRVIVQPGRTSWSLFVHGPRTKGWGFLRPCEIEIELADCSLDFERAWQHVEVDSSESTESQWWKKNPPGRAFARAAP